MNIENIENRINYIDIYPPKKEDLSLFDKACNYFNRQDFFIEDGTSIVIKSKYKYKKLKRLAIKTQKFHNKFLDGKIEKDKNFYQDYLNKYIKNNKNQILIYSPSQTKIRSAKKITILALATTTVMAVLPILSTVMGNYTQELISRIEVAMQGENKAITDDLIPKKINDLDTVENINNLKENNYIKLNDASLESIRLLTEDLNEVFQRYSNETQNITPSFLFVEYTNQIPSKLKIFCDIGTDKVTYFEYKIDNSEAETFKSLLESTSSTQVNDVINGLNQFLINKDIVDLPNVYNKITVDNINYYPSETKKEFYQTTWNDELQDYNYEDSYSFKYLHLDNSCLYETKIHISKDKAISLEGFNQNNLTTLYDVYRNNNAEFVKDYEIQHSYDLVSKILIASRNQNISKSNDLEK